MSVEQELTIVISMPTATILLVAMSAPAILGTRVMDSVELVKVSSNCFSSYNGIKWFMSKLWQGF